MNGVSAYTMDVASSELPCGAAWFANLLIELGVGVWHPWAADFSAEWIPLGQNRYRYQRADEGWRRVLPALRHGREFRFRDRPVPRFGHHWPMQYAALPAVLIVRDPRDALYSAWRRELALGTSNELRFELFVQSGFRGSTVSWLEVLALHTVAWSAQIRRHGGFVLRYEDFKRDALRVARRCAAALSIEVPTLELIAAVTASDHAESKQAEATLLQRGVVDRALVQRGVANEWRDGFTRAMHAALPAWLWQVFMPLGYEPVEPVSGADWPDLVTHLESDVDEFAMAAWREAMLPQPAPTVPILSTSPLDDLAMRSR